MKRRIILGCAAALCVFVVGSQSIWAGLFARPATTCAPVTHECPGGQLCSGDDQRAGGVLCADHIFPAAFVAGASSDAEGGNVMCPGDDFSPGHFVCAGCQLCAGDDQCSRGVMCTDDVLCASSVAAAASAASGCDVVCTRHDQRAGDLVRSGGELCAGQLVCAAGRELCAGDDECSGDDQSDHDQCAGHQLLSGDHECSGRELLAGDDQCAGSDVWAAAPRVPAAHATGRGVVCPGGIVFTGDHVCPVAGVPQATDRAV